jgi:hypothetical protein
MDSLIQVDLLHNKTKKIHKLYTDISKYTTDVSQFHQYDINIQDELENIEKYLKNIEKSLKYIESNVKTISSIELIQSMFEFYHYISIISYTFDNILCSLDALSNTSDKDLIYNISNTELESIRQLFINIKSLYGKYKTDTITIDIQIFQSLYSHKNNWHEYGINKVIETLNKNIKSYPFSVNMYAFIMQKLLLNCIPMGDTVCAHIIDSLEDIKDFILLESKKIGLNTRTVIKNNPHIKTFGLTPEGHSKPLNEIISKITKSDSSKSIKESSLESIAQKSDICIVLLNRVINKPLESSLWNIIDWNLSKQFLQGDLNGITQKTIDKFRTLAFIHGKNNKWDFSTDYYGDIDKDYFIIIEKLSSDSYRLLNIYDATSNLYKIKGGGILQTKIHRNHIKSFIDYITNKGVINTITRISEYHEIQERKILNNIFLPVKFNTKDINVQSQIIDTAYLRNEFHKKLTDGFNKIIKKEYNDGVNIKTSNDIGNIIHHKNLSDIFNSVLIEQYEIYSSKNADKSSTFPFSEILKTFLAEISLLNRRFKRDVHSTFTETKIDKSIFSDTITKKILLNKLFNEIITYVLGKLINNERNIYQSLIYKNSLLKLSLV